MEESALISLPSSEDEFVVHLGDWNNNNATCQIGRFETVYNKYSKCSAPVFFLPGDNEWNECSSDHDHAALWRNYFMHYTEKFWKLPYEINYQEIRGENFSFLRGYTLHVGLNVVSGTVWNQTEWDRRLNDNLKWVEQNVETYRDQIDLLVLYGHAGYSQDNALFFDNLVELIKQWNADESDLTTSNGKITVLYIKQGPKVNFREKYLTLSDFMVLTVQGNKWPPMRVTIDPDSKTITYDDETKSIDIILNMT